MDDMDFKPNSHKYKEEQAAAPTEQKRVKQTISGTATAKKNEIASIASVFISDDIHNVKEYLVKDMLVPTIKKAILGALDMILNGDSRTYAKRADEPKVSYRQFYDDPRDDYRRNEQPQASKRFDYDTIKFEYRGDAEMALAQLRDIIREYKLATVQDFYEIARLDIPYTANRYGWTNLDNAYIDRRGGGYIIKLPKAVPID